MIIDTHLHLDSRNYDNPYDAAAELSRQLKASQISRGIVIHLEVQNFAQEDFARAISKYENMDGIVSIHPYQENAAKLLDIAISKHGFIGLKIHPGLQAISLKDRRVADLIKLAGDIKIPVIIDAFPDGHRLLGGFNPIEYARLAVECSNTKIVWAHMGGHHVIDMAFLARRIENVHMDFSLSYLYYEGSSVQTDFVYCFKNMKYERVMYGSDYPDRSIENTVNPVIKSLKDYGIDNKSIKLLMHDNAQKLFYENGK